MKTNDTSVIQKIIKQFIKFGLVGGLNTVLSLAIQWGFLAMGFHYQIGNIVAFIITVFISYILNGKFVFQEKREKGYFSWKALIKVYISYSITGLFLNALLLYVWNEVVGLNPAISTLINLVFTIPINFVLNKFWAYK